MKLSHEGLQGAARRPRSGDGRTSRMVRIVALIAFASPALIAQVSASQAVIPDQGRVASAIDSTYLLSRGDFLDIRVFDTPELSNKARVSEDGNVVMPLIGSVHLSGLTPEAAAVSIERSLLDQALVLHPHVTVTVVDYAAAGVSVLGEVKLPGIYPSFGQHGVLDAIAAAGGLTPNAGRKVLVIHKGETGHQVLLDLPTAVEETNSVDIAIMPGDKVVVGLAGVIYVLGDVAHPGGYVTTRNEPSYSVLKLLALAQGTVRTAKLQHALILRRSNGQITATPVRVASILKQQVPDVQLNDGEILYVPSSTAKLLGYRALEAAFATTVGLTIYGRF